MNGADLLEGPGMAIAIGAAFLLLALIVLLRHKATRKIVRQLSGQT